MSQVQVYEMLKELGGTARSRDIAALARGKFPDLSLHSYVGELLHRLQKAGYVRYNMDHTWTAIDDSILSNRNVVTLE